MTITIKIDTGNAAFEDDRDREVFRIVAQWLNNAERLNMLSKASSTLYDVNGNSVGKVVVK